jgi:hypothetical protein
MASILPQFCTVTPIVAKATLEDIPCLLQEWSPSLDLFRFTMSTCEVVQFYFQFFVWIHSQERETFQLAVDIKGQTFNSK